VQQVKGGPAAGKQWDSCVLQEWRVEVCGCMGLGAGWGSVRSVASESREEGK